MTMELDISDLTSAILGVIVALLIIGLVGFFVVDLVIDQTDNPTFQMLVPTVMIVALVTVMVFPLYMLSSVMKGRK